MTIPDKATKDELIALANDEPGYTGRRVELKNGEHSPLLLIYEEWGDPDRVQLEYLDHGKIRMTRWIEVIK